MKILQLLYIIIFCLVCSLACSKEENKINSQESDILQVVDSIYLNYPDSLFPKGITDITYNENFLYVLNNNRNAKYPLVKFSKDGKFIKKIFKIGQGPKEINYFPQKISSKGENLAVFSITGNTLWILKNDSIKKKISLSIIEGEKYSISGISFLTKDKLLLTAYGRSKRHLVILDINTKKTEELQELPEEATITTTAGYPQINGLFKQENKFFTHIGYPPIIYNLTLLNEQNKIWFRKVYDGKTLNNFKKVKVEKLIKDYNDGKISPQNFLMSFSILYLIYTEDNYLLGIYNTPTMESKSFKIYIFILKNGIKIIEKEIDKNMINGLFVYENGLAKSHFYHENGLLKIKLYFLKLNMGYINNYAK